MKKSIAALLAATFTLSLAAVGSCSVFAEEDAIKIGVAWQDLSEQTFAEFSSFMQEYAPSEYGAEITIVSADWSAPTQVTQVENFIESGCDAIIVGPVDPASLADVTKKAIDEGIYVLSYAAHIDNYSAEYLVDDYNTGYAAGEAAAQWINDKLGGKAEYGVLDLPINDRLIARAQGMIDAITEKAPEATKVAQSDGGGATADGMNDTEDFLQAHPDMKVIVSIGDGGAIGANEAVKASGMDYSDFGIFAVDATQEGLQKIKNNEPLRGSVSIGGPIVQGGYMIDTVVAMVKGEEFERDGLMTYKVIDQSNCEEYAESIGWKLD